MQTTQFKVIGLKYGGCAATVERALRAMGGVRSATVSFATGEATVRFDEQLTSPDKLNLAVMSAGYQCELERAEAERSRPPTDMSSGQGGS